MLNSTENDCSCMDCKKMCLNSPCFPTPEEVVILEKNAFGSDLLFTLYCNPKTLDIYPLVAPKSLSIGNLNVCTFLDKDGLCELHELGLKPIEGKLAKHGTTEDNSIELRVSICNSWDSDLGKNLLLQYGGEDYLTEIENITEKIKNECGQILKD